MGLLGHDVPEEYGGLGGDKTSSSLITEAASRQGSFAVSFGAHVGIGTMPIVLFGTPEQRKKYLPKLATGEMIAAYALTEPGSGSDALAAKTKAVKSADGKSWKLTGTKQYITNAGFADLFTVFAKVDGEQFTAFLVERSAPGLTIGPEEHKLGIRGSSTCPLFLEDCTIPVDERAGDDRPGAQDRLQHPEHRALEAGRGRRSAGAKYCLELGVKFARERKQFGKPIAEFDLIRKKIGDIATQTYVAESMAFRTAGLLDARSKAIDPARPAGAEEADRRHRGARHRGVDHQGVRLARCCTRPPTRRCRSSAAPATSRTTRSNASAATRASTASSRGPTRSTACWCRGRMLKRAMQGRLPLMALVGQVQQELADPIKIDRRVPDGPLGRERKKCDFAKRAIAYGASLGVQKYMQAISEKQELLGVLADCLILIFAMDSAITRTLQLIAAKGEATSQVPLCMTQLFVRQGPRAGVRHACAR